MVTEPKRIDITEFHELGFLQEANRQFFHPRGLALEVVIEEDGSAVLGGVWDYRDDPEGIIFGELDGDDNRLKASQVEAEYQRHIPARLALFGEVVQPIGDRR